MLLLLPVCEDCGGENLFLTRQTFDYGPFILKGSPRSPKKNRETNKTVALPEAKSAKTDGAEKDNMNQSQWKTDVLPLLSRLEDGETLVGKMKESNEVVW